MRGLLPVQRVLGTRLVGLEALRESTRVTAQMGLMAALGLELPMVELAVPLTLSPVMVVTAILELPAVRVMAGLVGFYS